MSDERPVTVGEWLQDLGAILDAIWSLASAALAAAWDNLINLFLALPLEVVIAIGGGIFAVYAIYDSIRILRGTRRR